MYHDPFQNLIQNNPILASHYAAAGMNPLSFGQGAIWPQQLHALLAQQQGLQQLPGVSFPSTGIPNPMSGIQNPGLAFQNPALLLNPSVSSGLQAGVNPLLALASAIAQQLVSQQQSPYSQFAQPGVPFGQGAYPQLGQSGPVPQQFYAQQTGNALAPQSWVGQGGSIYGQLPTVLSQLAGRPFQSAGISPWGW
jgi:hypothetical protein